MSELLNLPEFDIKLRQVPEGGVQVFDPLRGRWVVLTPEEWVRQHFVNYLAVAKMYPTALMANEVRLKFNGMSRRCDTVVYDHAFNPLMIVEYKRATVPITQRVFDQIARYTITMGARWLVVSNGLRHYCCRIDGGSYAFVRDIPSWTAVVRR